MRDERIREVRQEVRQEVMRTSVTKTCMRIVELERENVKLRELVSDLMPIVCEGCHERLCDMPKEEHPFVECLFDCRMRELGIEVDE